PYALTQRDFTSEDEQRWITVGAIGPGSILLAVHTFHEQQGEEIIRIISARAAEKVCTASRIEPGPIAPTVIHRYSTSDVKSRWITVGAIEPGSILLAVHTFHEQQGEEIIRIISARAADSHERRAYEEAHKGAEARHPRHHRKKRPGH